jgi:glycosyltransferase involved in cell wall biosynthesis
MRILHIIPSLLPESGGPSRAVPELCRALGETGIQVTLFSTHARGHKLSVEPSAEPYEIVLFPAKNGSLTGARQIGKAIKDRVSDFDLIHIHSLWNLAATWAADAARDANIPYVVSPRGMLSETCLRQRHYVLKHAYAWALERRTVQAAARLHFLNADEFRASRNGWFKNPRHFIAANGVKLDPDSTKPDLFRARVPEFENRRVMLFLGRLHGIKGLDLQLQALQQLIPKHPDLIWLLIGPDGGEWRRLKSLIRQAGLEAHVKWMGPIMDDVRYSALAAADVLLQTSFYECQSMTVNEALAVGVPLVVTDSINYAEVESAGAGYVVRRDPAEVARAVESILESSDGGAAMRSAGRRFAADKLAWPRIAATVKLAYGEAIEEIKQSEIVRGAGRTSRTA